MKKVILIMILAFGFSQISNAQIDFGIKGGVNYSSNSITDASQDVFEGGDNKSGYHAGVWARFNLPIGFYVRPELVYTNLKNGVTYTGAGNLNQETSYNFQKIDIPILLGKKFFNVANVFVGPSFQYIINSDFGINDIQDVDANGFTMGFQVGAGVEFGKVGIDVRWEKSFSDIESSFVSNIGNVTFDTRVDQIVIGLSVQL